MYSNYIIDEVFECRLDMYIIHTSPCQALRSVWHIEVKRILIRTSIFWGGSTLTSSITNGSPGPHVIAASNPPYKMKMSTTINQQWLCKEKEWTCIIAEPLTFAGDDLPCCLTWVAQTIFHLSLNVVVLANIADHQLAQEFVWCFFWLFVLLINLFLEFLWHQHHYPWLWFYN